jgi:NAD(P)-dependent dehydrogenase (short-subunit alcohol dehydrogenase family)
MADEQTGCRGAVMGPVATHAGRVAIVTGGARGAGAALATAFVAPGVLVVVANVLDAEGKDLGRT